MKSIGSKMNLARWLLISTWCVLCGLSGSCVDAAGPEDAGGHKIDAVSDSVSTVGCEQHVDCDDHNECTRDLCGINAVCNHVVQTEIACDDGDPCTQGAVCQGNGQCGGPSVAPMPAPECFSCTCDSEQGMDCSPVSEGEPCFDLNPCTVDESCSVESKCEGSSPCVHGECVVSGDSYICNCDEGWSGERCAQP